MLPLNVSQDDGSSSWKPIFSHLTRWAEDPWVQVSGLTRRPAVTRLPQVQD